MVSFIHLKCLAAHVHGFLPERSYNRASPKRLFLNFRNRPSSLLPGFTPTDIVNLNSKNKVGNESNVIRTIQCIQDVRYVHGVYVITDTPPIYTQLSTSGQT